jgi:large subunit ribosomal protein L23
MHWRNVILRPIITEKSNFQAQTLGQYSFVVNSKANKAQIHQAIELAWPEVVVDKIRVANMPAKRSRRWRSVTVRKPAYKKAIVKLAEGTIDIFEGV